LRRRCGKGAEKMDSARASAFRRNEKKMREWGRVPLLRGRAGV